MEQPLSHVIHQQKILPLLSFHLQVLYQCLHPPCLSELFTLEHLQSFHNRPSTSSLMLSCFDACFFFFTTDPRDGCMHLWFDESWWFLSLYPARSTIISLLTWYSLISDSLSQCITLSITNPSLPDSQLKLLKLLNFSTFSNLQVLV